MRKAFTLVELLIVIAIIAILAAIAIPQYTNYVRKAAAANAQSTLSSCLSAAMAQFADNGTKTYDCKVDLGNGTSKDVYIILNDTGNLEYIGTSSNATTTDVTLTIKGHKVKCTANTTTNTITCEPTT
ncbi:prepilin-type N-terminal cleavage/methylation domain-containing protein [Thermovibrio sp.]